MSEDFKIVLLPLSNVDFCLNGEFIFPPGTLQEAVDEYHSNIKKRPLIKQSVFESSTNLITL